MKQTLLLVGLSYRTAGVDVREKFTLTRHCAPETWAIPVGVVEGKNQIDEALILSTCNRVEVLVVGQGEHIKEMILSLWAGACGQPRESLEPHVYAYEGAEAIRHLFTVASSLDSMVIGEPQILGQLKDAYRKATAAHMTGGIINRLLHRAFSVAKRVRTETEVASNAVSISYAAVELAKRIFGDMSEYKALLIGAGEMAELAATHLIQAGVSGFLVTNRTFSHAQQLAEHFNGSAVPFENLIECLTDADIIISSTGAQNAILHARDMQTVLARRKNKPMFIIDIAVPRDIDPDVNNLDNIYLYDIDDLKEVVEGNLAHRRLEAQKATMLVDEETNGAVRWLHSLALQPCIVDLLEHLDQLAASEVAKTCKHLHSADDELRDAMLVMMKSFSRKIVHNSLEYMKSSYEMGEMDNLRLVRGLFALDEPLRHRHCKHRCVDAVGNGEGGCDE